MLAPKFEASQYTTNPLNLCFSFYYCYHIGYSGPVDPFTASIIYCLLTASHCDPFGRSMITFSFFLSLLMSCRPTNHGCHPEHDLRQCLRHDVRQLKSTRCMMDTNDILIHYQILVIKEEQCYCICLFLPENKCCIASQMQRSDVVTKYRNSSQLASPFSS